MCVQPFGCPILNSIDEGKQPQKIKFLDLVTNRDFAFLLYGGISASVTMTLRTLVSFQWLYQETGSAATLGLLGVVQFLHMPLAVYGGILADRVDRKKLMAFTQLTSFILLIALTGLAWKEMLEPWHIFVITGVAGIFNMLGSAAKPAMLPRVVPRHLLSHAVTSQTACAQMSGILAPLLFWQLYDYFGVTTAFAVAAIIAMTSTVSPLLIRASGQPDESKIKNTFNSLKEGYLFVINHRLLPGLYSLDIAVTVVSFYRQLFPVFAFQLYGLGASGTGLLNTANSVGAVAGTLLVLYTSRFNRKGLLVLIATLSYAFLLLAFGVNKIFVVGLIIVGMLGAMDAVGMTMRQAVVQLTTPDRLLGRASRAHSFAAMGANNIGQVHVGVMAGLIGAGATMVLGGVISIVGVVFIWKFIPGIQRYRYDPDKPFEEIPN